MPANQTQSASHGEKLVIQRSFNTSRERVFHAWTSPTLMRQWSCPTGFTIEFGEGEPVPGHAWRCGMRGQDGELHVACGEYLEVTPPARLVMTHAWENDQGQPGRATTVTIEISERGGLTTMTFTQEGFQSRESLEGHRGGWAESFDKLHTILQSSK